MKTTIKKENKMRKKDTRTRQQIHRDNLTKMANKARRRRKLSNFIHSDLILGLTELLTVIWLLAVGYFLLIVASIW
jgi:hypothetical protein